MPGLDKVHRCAHEQVDGDGGGTTNHLDMRSWGGRGKSSCESEKFSRISAYKFLKAAANSCSVRARASHFVISENGGMGSPKAIQMGVRRSGIQLRREYKRSLPRITHGMTGTFAMC